MGQRISWNETWEGMTQIEDKGNKEWAQDTIRERKIREILGMEQSQLLIPPRTTQSYSSQSDRSGSSNVWRDSYLITGSAFFMKAKTRLESNEKKAVARHLAEALGADSFFKVWPGHEDRPGTEKAAGKSSPEFRNVGDRRRREFKENWDCKEERSIERRGRVEGGYEDTMEAEALRSTDMFRPTLRSVLFKEYDDEYRGTKMQSIQESIGTIGRERMSKPTAHRVESRTDQKRAEGGSNKKGY
ncbi:hypothetical protein QTJ16_005874 [Diplocarpon rosae]|uniref:Uncharacterized protein n=1 Tax=Diplocarpon rosae TaxID=946125 RepID=A0AAD9SVW6_9HELO|nr:hypothetical protein QTJ16_005874 [Diplocarpon rosae]